MPSAIPLGAYLILSVKVIEGSYQRLLNSSDLGPRWGRVHICNSMATLKLNCLNWPLTGYTVGRTRREESFHRGAEAEQQRRGLGLEFLHLNQALLHCPREMLWREHFYTSGWVCKTEPLFQGKNNSIKVPARVKRLCFLTEKVHEALPGSAYKLLACFWPSLNHPQLPIYSLVLLKEFKKH